MIDIFFRVMSDSMDAKSGPHSGGGTLKKLNLRLEFPRLDSMTCNGAVSVNKHSRLYRARKSMMGQQKISRVSGS